MLITFPENQSPAAGAHRMQPVHNVTRRIPLRGMEIFPEILLGWAFPGGQVSFVRIGSGDWFGTRAEQLRKFDNAAAQQSPVAPDRHALEGVEIGHKPGQLKLSPNVIESLKVQVAEIRRAPATEPLTLAGSLFLDSSHLAI